VGFTFAFAVNMNHCLNGFFSQVILVARQLSKVASSLFKGTFDENKRGLLTHLLVGCADKNYIEKQLPLATMVSDLCHHPGVNPSDGLTSSKQKQLAH
jgi:hypothetical protein